MNHNLSCKICSKNFESKKRVPLILPHCGHTLCKPCLRIFMKQIKINIKNSKNDHCFLVCPFDEKKLKIYLDGSMKIFKKNLFLLDMINERKVIKD